MQTTTLFLREIFGQRLTGRVRSTLTLAAIWGVLLVGAAAEVNTTRPYVLVSPDELGALEALAAESPWKEMAQQAVADAANRSIHDGSGNIELGDGFLNLRDVISANALAYVVDPAGRESYVGNLYETMNVGLGELDGVIGNDTFVANVLFNAIIALDLIRDDLPATSLSEVEYQINAMQGGLGGEDPSAAAVQRMWDLYGGTLIEELTPPEIGGITADGIFAHGTGPALARLHASDREQMHLYMDVFDRRGHSRGFYTDLRLQKLYEFVYGYAVDPMGYVVPFGNSMDGHFPGTPANASTAMYRVSQFSPTAARHLVWQLQHHAPSALDGPLGRLLPYVFAKEALNEYLPRFPASRIFPDGGAFFIEDRPAPDALYAALWNPSVAGEHSHKEVNSIAITAYGEMFLRNAGFASWGNGGSGLSWSEIHDNATTANTVLIDGVDHVSKAGGTIIRGFTGDGLDFAAGFDGGAIPGADHYRNLVFVDSDGSVGGYWILFDQLSGAQSGAEANVLLRPYSRQVNEVASGTEYTFAVDQNTRTINNVRGSIFFGTPPDAVAIGETGMASGESSFRTQYLDSVFSLGSAGERTIVTVLYPHDDTRMKADMARLEGEGFVGAVIAAGRVRDVALESSVAQRRKLEGVSFQADLLWYRKREKKLTSFFAQGARSLNDHSLAPFGFSSDANTTIYLNAEGETVFEDEVSRVFKAGRIAPEADGLVTFYYPNLQHVRLNGQRLRPLGAGEGRLTVSIRRFAGVGAHEIEFELSKPGLRTYREWADEAGLTGDDSDPAAFFGGGEASNLLRYAFGRDADLPANATRLPQLDPASPGELLYHERRGAEDLDYQVEVSEDLVTWHSGSSYSIEEYREVVDGEFDRVRVRAMLGGDNPWRLFMRVRVALGTTMKRLVYKESHGESQEIEVYFPAGWNPDKRVPGVILFHGGSWINGSLEQFQNACTYLASRGIVAATANYRMWTMEERALLPAGESFKRVCITDAKSAIRWMKEKAGDLGVDPERIVTGGGSAGGHVSVLATTNPGLNDPGDSLEYDTYVLGYLLLFPAFVSTDGSDPEVDIYQHMTVGFAPVVSFFGTNDHAYLPSWNNIVSELKQLGVPVQSWLAQGQGHGFANYEPWQTLTLIFIDRFLADLGLLEGGPTLVLPGTVEYYLAP